MSRPKGSIIGAKPTWTTTATSGIWSLRQAEEMKADAKWPRGPVAPTSLAGTGSNGQVALTWTAPATTHGTITDYEVEYTAPYIEAGDQYWASVAILLPLDGSNSSTTFTDASTNAISVTRSNQTVISTAQSKFGGASAFFDGSGDRLNISNAAIAPGEGDFAVEFWLRASAVNANKVLYAFAADADPGIWLRSNGTIAFYYDSGVYAASNAISANTWYHVAVSRASGVVRVFVDGVPSNSTYTFTNSITSTSASIGGVANFDGGTLSGYIDDFRLTVGSARGYTAAFTPPAAAHPANGNVGQAAVNQTVRTGSTAASYTVTGLTNGTEYTFRVAAVNHTRGDWSDSVAVTPSDVVTDPDFASVSLLMHFDDSNGSTTFTDSSSNGWTGITASGGASISTAQSKFGGSSLRYDSSYISIPYDAGLYDFGSSDFVIEFWLYVTSKGPANAMFATTGGGISTYANGSAWSLYNQINASDNRLTFLVGDFAVLIPIIGGGGSGAFTAETPGTYSTDQWHYLSIVRSGNTLRTYQNGILAATDSYSGSFSVTSDPLIIGGGGSGYFDDLRITVGTDRGYTGATIDVPAAAFPDA